MVDVLDMDGNLARRLATNGVLSAPWGMAIAPGGVEHGLFGSLAPPSAVLSVWNAASEDHDVVSPGEIVLLRGLTIGPRRWLQCLFR